MLTEFVLPYRAAKLGSTWCVVKPDGVVEIACDFRLEAEQFANDMNDHELRDAGICWVSVEIVEWLARDLDRRLVVWPGYDIYIFDSLSYPKVISFRQEKIIASPEHEDPDPEPSYELLFDTLHGFGYDNERIIWAIEVLQGRIGLETLSNARKNDYDRYADRLLMTSPKIEVRRWDEHYLTDEHEF